MRLQHAGWRRQAFPWLMLLPALALMAAVNLLPIVQGFYMSLLKLNQFTLSQYLDAPFIGLDNYRRVLLDADNPLRQGLGLALRNTGLFALVVSSLSIATGLGLALLMHRDFPGRQLARSLLLLPWVVPSYVVGTLWGQLFQRDTGAVNALLVDTLHLVDERPFWLLGANSFWAIVVPTVWRNAPLLMLIFLAALQALPAEPYEAARLDGANAWQRFRHLTLPLLKPVIVIQALFQLIDNVYSYNIVSMMFGQGAGHPGEWADLLMPLLTRQSFSYWLFGQGAAVSFVLMALMLAVVALWLRVFRSSLVGEHV